VADVVAAIVPVDGVSTLVAYVQPYEPAADNMRAIHTHFQAVAPGHVAGAELIAVDTIQRHADGSADLSRLPAPGTAKLSESSVDQYVPPRDELESSLVAIWKTSWESSRSASGRLLQAGRLFADDRAPIRAHQQSARYFTADHHHFQRANRRAISRHRSRFALTTPRSCRYRRREPGPFLHDSFVSAVPGYPQCDGSDHPFYGLRELDTDAEDMTVEQRAATYLDAMRSIQPHGPYYIGGWCAAGPLAVETARQITASGERSASWFSSIPGGPAMPLNLPASRLARQR